MNTREVTVSRALSDDGRRIDTPKDGKARVVDVSRQLAETLRTYAVACRAEAIKAALSADERLWLFAERTGSPIDPHNALIADGKSPAYVQDQLGHDDR